MRSWTHSKGLSASNWARRNPAQPPSREWLANNSERVGLGDSGKRQRSPNPLGKGDILAARLAPPATRDKPLATRLTTFLFYFCSYPATRQTESILRLGKALGAELFQELADLAHDLLRRCWRDPERHMVAGQLDFLVALMVESARGARRDQPVAA